MIGLIFATTVLAIGLPAEARKFALVIGNGAYTHLGADSQLPNAVSDASDVAVRLQQLGFQVGYAQDAVETNDGSTRLREAITNFSRQLSDGDDVVVYYAGHGIELAGEDYLLPVDADIMTSDDVKVWGFPISDLYFSKSKHVQVIIIFDACRDNPFLRRANAQEVGGNIQVPQGDMVFFSAGAGQEARDSDAGAPQGNPTRNSVFASAFLQQLQRPGLTQTQLYRLTRDAVEARTQSQQLPSSIENLNQDVVFNTQGMAGPTYVAMPVPATAAPIPTPGTTQLAATEAPSPGGAPMYRSVASPDPVAAAAPGGASAAAPPAASAAPAVTTTPVTATPVTATPPAANPPAPAPTVGAGAPTPAGPAPTVVAVNTPPQPPIQSAQPAAPPAESFNLASLGPMRLPPRPDLPVVPEVKLPASFCSLKEKFDFHDQVYLPAQVRARERYDAAELHLHNLDGLRREYLQLSTDKYVFISAIIDEFIAYKKLITDPAFEASNAYVAMHDTIMAIPVAGACK